MTMAVAGACPAKQTEFYKVSLPLRRWLREHVADYDVVHVHAVFSFASSAACAAARAAGVPFIVRPLGVLNSWGMQNRRRWVKSLSFRWLDKPLLDAAAAIHFTSQAEADEAAELSIRARPAVIPAASSGRNFLFLSRIDPKKGLELLLDAFATSRAGRQGWQLVVAGAGDKPYEDALKERARASGISDRVLWTGFLEGDQRLAALAACQVFVLPSSSENFGVALLEAMAVGLPCISTEGVALAREAGGAADRTHSAGAGRRHGPPRG
jgi:glycosyltransferase involved in cell wall biosynthesis